MMKFARDQIATRAFGATQRSRDRDKINGEPSSYNIILLFPLSDKRLATRSARLLCVAVLL